MDKVAARKLKSRAEFILAIRKARREGYNPSELFVEHEERLALLNARIKGLLLITAFVVFGPFTLIAAKIACAAYHIAVDFQTDMLCWVCWIIGVPSVLAFGYKLHIPQKDPITHAIEIISDKIEDTLELRSIDVDTADGVDGGV